YNAVEDDTEGVVNELLSVKGVEVAFLLREAKPGKVRGSVRARGDVDVAAIVRQFGGGGHKNAAGVSFQGDPFEAETLLREAILIGMSH
ncbi:MAG: DHHA1 domain-containing protein, partial [Armatimonadota bacterium]